MGSCFLIYLVACMKNYWLMVCLVKALWHQIGIKVAQSHAGGRYLLLIRHTDTKL